MSEVNSTVATTDEEIKDAQFDAMLAEPETAEPPEVVLPKGHSFRFSPSDAYWPKDPANAPDTWHLPPAYATGSFELTGDLIRRHAALGDYPLNSFDHGLFILGLRGAALADGARSAEDQTSVSLTAVRPDHETYRCLVGVFDIARDRLSVYQGSTVPRRTGMAAYANGGRRCNMLPTGLYGYCVGNHYSKRNGQVWVLHHVLRLGRGPELADASDALVLRTRNDLAYGTQDVWDLTDPRDNIHPAFIKDSFSSLGCLTVRGSQAFDDSSAEGSDEWKQFRRVAQVSGATRGRNYQLLLTTAHELAAISATTPADGLICLRQGSYGERVRRLQGQLGVAQDMSLGPLTAEALTKAQIAALGFSTATWSARMATMMGLKF